MLKIDTISLLLAFPFIAQAEKTPVIDVSYKESVHFTNDHVSTMYTTSKKRTKGL